MQIDEEESVESAYKRVRVRDYFSPLPKQQQAFNLIGRKRFIFYGGARSGGKTAFALWAALMCSLQYPKLNIAVARKTYREAEEISGPNLVDRFPPEVFGYRWNKRRLTAEFENGSRIALISLNEEKDVQKEKGIERGLYILDEGNELTWDTIIRLLGSNRVTDVPGWRATMIITGNPGGACDSEIRNHFVHPEYDKWEPQLLDLKDQFAYIHSSPYDNPHNSRDTIRQYQTLPTHLRKQWLEGDWDSASGRFFEEWNKEVHVCQPFDIPDDWVKWFAVDIGYKTHESVCLWLAQNPETGVVYVYREFGTKEHVTEVFVERIKEFSHDEEYAGGWLDPQLFSKNRDRLAEISPADLFMQAGFFVYPADNKRQTGWHNIKNWMHWSDVKAPMLQVFPSCRGLIDTIPNMQYVPNKFDLNTRSRDDYVDALRYGLAHIYPLQLMAEDASVSGVGKPPEPVLDFETDRSPERVGTRRGSTQYNVYLDGEYTICSPYAIY
jgi:hypothetical protein